MKGNEPARETTLTNYYKSPKVELPTNLLLRGKITHKVLIGSQLLTEPLTIDNSWPVVAPSKGSSIQNKTVKGHWKDNDVIW